MTAQEALKRVEKSQWLKVWQAGNTDYYVESEDGKIAYKCSISDQGMYCNCGDYASRSKNDPQFKCKHLLAVMNSIPRDQVLEAQLLDKRKPKLDERFIKQVDGKDFVLYAGLLDLAHQKDLVSMDVELIQCPGKDNDHTAICKAIAKTAVGGPFIDVGDANPVNCNSKVVKHIIRMASTRAKARALRDLTNIGMTALEELGDFNEVIGIDDHPAIRPGKSKRDNVKPFAKPAVKAKPEVQETTKPVSQAVVQVNDKPETVQEQTNLSETIVPAEAKPPVEKKTRAPKPNNGNGNGKSKPEKVILMSEAQKSALFNLSRRRGISVEDLEKRAQDKYSVPVEQLTTENAGEFIRYLQQSA
jgi:hypothetical protein